MGALFDENVNLQNNNKNKNEEKDFYDQLHHSKEYQYQISLK